MVEVSKRLRVSLTGLKSLCRVCGLPMSEASLQLLQKLTRELWPNATLSVSVSCVQISLSGYTSARILFLVEAVEGRATPLLTAIAALKCMTGAV